MLGVVVVLMGVAFLGFVPFLQRDTRLHVSPSAGLWGAPLLGIVFGLGWAPCIGPTLAAVLALSLDEGSAARGAVLSVAYCLGLGLPFLLIALAVQRSTARARRSCAGTGSRSPGSAGRCSCSSGSPWSPGCGARGRSRLQGLVAGFRPVV